MPLFGEHRVMACTRVEMARWLNELAPGRVTASPAGFELDIDGWSLKVDLTELEPRRFGLVKLAALGVHFHYPESARAAAHAWIERFDRHTMRGGG